MTFFSNFNYMVISSPPPPPPRGSFDCNRRFNKEIVKNDNRKELEKNEYLCPYTKKSLKNKIKSDCASHGRAKWFLIALTLIVKQQKFMQNTRFTHDQHSKYKSSKLKFDVNQQRSTQN
jgi:hypothetical protein